MGLNPEISAVPWLDNSKLTWPIPIAPMMSATWAIAVNTVRAALPSNAQFWALEGASWSVGAGDVGRKCPQPVAEMETPTQEPAEQPNSPTAHTLSQPRFAEAIEDYIMELLYRDWQRLVKQDCDPC